MSNRRTAPILIGVGLVATIAVGGAGAALAEGMPGSAPAPASGTTVAGKPAGTHIGGLNVAAIPKTPKLGVVGRPQPVFKVDKQAASFKGAGVSFEDKAPTPGQQGNVGSCVAWAIGYTGYGTIMGKSGIPGAPMAPMFLYAQAVKGNDSGTYGKLVLDLAVEQGIAPKKDYANGDFDYTTQPNAQQKAAAAKYKLSGYETLPVKGDAAKQKIMSSLDNGMPVAIGINVYNDINNMPADVAKSGDYRPSGGYAGGHEITIIGYDSKGVRIQNSWGPEWGDGGRFNLSWDYLVNSGDLLEAYAMGKINYTGGDATPGPSDPSSTSNPTDEPSTDPTSTPTATDQPNPGPTLPPVPTNPGDGGCDDGTCPGDGGGCDDGTCPGDGGGCDDGTCPGGGGGCDDGTCPGGGGGCDDGTCPGGGGGCDDGTCPGGDPVYPGGDPVYPDGGGSCDGGSCPAGPVYDNGGYDTGYDYGSSDGYADSGYDG